MCRATDRPWRFYERGNAWIAEVGEEMKREVIYEKWTVTGIIKFGNAKILPERNWKMRMIYTAYVEYDPETNLYVGIIPALPGAHSQAATLDELQHNLQEVARALLEEM